MSKSLISPDLESQFKRYTITAQVGELVPDTDTLTLAQKALHIAGYNEAAVSPVGDNGKPRMLKITAWIAHAGKPNRNGDAFVAEDLKAAVEGDLFAPPYFGMIDFNHDFSSYGAWFKATYAYDPQAEAWGILAEGAIFAWRYTDLADKLLATMQRDGTIPVSMACIPETVEYAQTEEGMDYAVLRNPIFFTSSVLDVDPADPNARGLATEDPTETPEAREHVLLMANFEDLAGEFTWSITTAEDISDQEDSMNMEELLATIKAAVGEIAEEHREVLASLVEKASRLPEVEAELATVRTENEELTARVATLEAEVETANLALDEARSRVEELETANGELAAFKAEIEAERAEKARQELREARLAELNESARERLDARPEDVREKIIARIVEADEDEFELIKETLNLARSNERMSYQERSEREGVLTGFADPTEGSFAIYKYTK